jgi:DNA-binding transcriptional ArsR family regulator
MDENLATGVFAALAQGTRLAVFRLLVETKADGMPAGEIARQLGTPHNTMSSHLAILARAGLVTSRRKSRSVIYMANYDGIRALIAYLLTECCKGHPETCAPLIDAVLAPTATRCCPPALVPTEH